MASPEVNREFKPRECWEVGRQDPAEQPVLNGSAWEGGRLSFPLSFLSDAMPATLRYVQPVSGWPFAGLSQLQAEESKWLCTLVSVLAEGTKASTGSQVPVPVLKKAPA